jgi:glycosyltransferase involved in cell wall biosynthesis
MFEYIWAFVLFTIRLTRLELRQHFDIIHVHNMPDFLVFTGILPRLRGARLLLDLHDPMPELFMSKYDLERSTLIRLIELQERISLRFAHHLITVDDSFKRIFVGRGARAAKFSIVRNMPDNRFFVGRTYEPPDNRFVLIYTGTIAERYQLHRVIEAIAQARPTVPNIHLRLVGKLDKEGDYTRHLTDLVQQLDLGDTVEFHPPVLLDEIPRLLQQAHVGLEPSRHDPYTDYVLPLKLLESVAVGLPCLVSRRPTIEAYFSEDMVCYFEPGDIDELTANIIRLAQNRDRLADYARCARQVFDRYNWSKEKQTYLDLIQNL